MYMCQKLVSPVDFLDTSFDSSVKHMNAYIIYVYV